MPAHPTDPAEVTAHAGQGHSRPKLQPHAGAGGDADPGRRAAVPVLEHEPRRGARSGERAASCGRSTRSWTPPAAVLLLCRGVSYYHDAQRRRGQRLREPHLHRHPGCAPHRPRCAETASRALTSAAAGTVDLKARLGPTLPGDYGVTVPPAIIGDRVIVGGRITEDMRTDMPAGVVRAFDAHSGALLWAWNSVPPQARGRARRDGTYRRSTANTWSVFSVDPQRNLVFIPTGNAQVGPVRHHARCRRARLLRQLGRRARCGHRQGRVALPDRAPRHLGLRRAVAAGAVRFPERARAGARARAADQAGLPLHPQSRDRRAADAGRGAPGAAGGAVAGGASRADPAGTHE